MSTLILPTRDRDTCGKLRPTTHRPAFTLMELLVTIAIIGILASLLLGALFSAQNMSRAHKTRSIILKLDKQIMAKMEGLATRRLPTRIVSLPGVVERQEDPYGTPAGTGTDLDSVPGMGYAWRQLNARRDLMRMELPDRWSDVTGPPLVVDPVTGAPLPLPPVVWTYRSYLNSNLINPAVLNSFQDCECLYMILTTGAGDPESAEALRHMPVGDADADGLNEFHDGWGQPIRFLRWAPGFVSGVQPQPGEEFKDLNRNGYYDAGEPYVDANINTAYDFDFATRHDPYDTRKVHMPDLPSQPPRRPLLTTGAHALFPLIYSGGPDEEEDITRDDWDRTSDAIISYAYTLDGNGNLDPYAPLATSGKLMGTPNQHDTRTDSFGNPVDVDTDNIYNHLLTAGGGR